MYNSIFRSNMTFVTWYDVNTKIWDLFPGRKNVILPKVALAHYMNDLAKAKWPLNNQDAPGKAGANSTGSSP